jgi:hypothetical protein
MKDHKPHAALLRPLAFVVLLTVATLACGTLGSAPFEETFDDPGNWGAGSSDDVRGEVADGQYQMEVRSNAGLLMATSGESFGDAVYELEATQIDGPLNNGYGMLFRVDESSDSFYAFEVSGDGYIWIGWCSELCRGETVALVGGNWFRSAAVNKGLQETNRLRVVAEGTRMTFYVNGIEVGRTSDGRLAEGDIAVAVETLGEPGVRVAFDNFKVTPSR